MHRLLPEIQCFRLNGGGGASTLLACTPHPGPLPGAENDTPRLGITGPCRVPPTVILGGGAVVTSFSSRSPALSMATSEAGSHLLTPGPCPIWILTKPDPP